MNSTPDIAPGGGGKMQRGEVLVAVRSALRLDGAYDAASQGAPVVQRVGNPLNPPAVRPGSVYLPGAPEAVGCAIPIHLVNLCGCTNRKLRTK